MELEPIGDIPVETYIFNPTKQDFTYSWLGKPYTIKSYEGQKFPTEIADHLAKHLKNNIVGEMKGVITDTIIEKVLKSIYMT